MINYNHYRMFCWVAETESMSRAAEIVGVTDSAVSHTIRALESQLGGKLFLRTPAKTLKLTLLGRRVFERMKPAFEMIDRADREAKLLVESNIRAVSVASIHGIIEHLLLDTSSLLRLRQPKYTFRFESCSLRDVAQYVRSGRTQLGILLTPNGDASDLKTTPVAPVREVFIAHRSLLNTAKTPPSSTRVRFRARRA